MKAARQAEPWWLSAGKTSHSSSCRFRKGVLFGCCHLACQTSRVNTTLPLCWIVLWSWVHVSLSVVRNAATNATDLSPPPHHLCIYLPQEQWIFKLIFSFLFLQNVREATRPKTWEASRRESLPMWMMRPCATLPPLSLHRPPSPPPAPLSGSQMLRAAPPKSRISHLTALLQSQLCPVSPPSTHLGLSNNANLLFI